MVLAVYDGDTMTVALPISGSEVFKLSVRMEGIDTPEMKSKLPDNRAKAIQARNRLIQLCGIPGVALETPLVKKEIVALCEKYQPIVALECGDWDKYGRLLVKVRALPAATSAPGWEVGGAGSGGAGATFSEILIAERFAYAYGGETKLTEAEQSAALD
jgi:endonuclease YncB( thermonuclease family)